MDVGIRELKARLSEYVDRAAGGKVVRVTDRGVPRAALMPLPAPVVRLVTHDSRQAQAVRSLGWSRPDMTMVNDHGVSVMAMEETTVPASTFKARCLSLLDEVARTRTGIVVTKHGKPVAKLVPLDDEPMPTLGSVTLLVDDDEAYFSTGESWVAEG